MTDLDLLRSYADLMAELRRRDVVRSSNNPVADYAERLVSRVLRLELERGSEKGFDATDGFGKRVQIKGRRRTPENRSTQLSQIRDLASDPFDYLAAVMFKANFDVEYAAIIPIDVVRQRSRFSDHTNSWRFMFAKTVFDAAGVVDITVQLRRCQAGQLSRKA